MAENTLNKIFSLEKQIEEKKDELKTLQKEHDALMGMALTSGKTENRYYQIKSKITAGDRVIQINLFREKYPELVSKYIIETVKVTEVKKDLGDEVISEISIRKPDTVRYWVEKKPVEGVITV